MRAKTMKPLKAWAVKHPTRNTIMIGCISLTRTLGLKEDAKVYGSKIVRIEIHEITK